MIGPDWKFSLVKLGLVNLIVGGIVSQYSWEDESKLFKKVGIMVLMFENLAFLATMLLNPGLATRNPNVHSTTYMNLVKNV